MKRIVLIGDGMGDYPVEELGHKTPLQAASIPRIRRIAAAGAVRMIQTIPPGMQPGSDVANLGLLGYNPAENYTGRAPIEAAGAGIPMEAQHVAFRCNLVTLHDEKMNDYSAGHITTEEAHQLIAALDRELGRDGLRFHGGVNYRHLLIWREGPAELRTPPPHEISDKPVADYLPQGRRQDEVQTLMTASRALFADHPVNKKRIDAGKKPATQIWLWGQGPALTLKTFHELYGLSGGIISAVDLVRGIGVLAGLHAPVIPDATGFIDTNYAGKVEAALDLLDHHDFVYVHIEAPDECGHMGDAQLKTEAIEAFDKRVVKPIWEGVEARGEPYRLVVTMDHRTPVSLRGHTSEPVPIAILDGPCGMPTEETVFDEFVREGKAGCLSHELIQETLRL